MQKLTIRKANSSDAETLSQLTIRSKSFWKYSAAQIDKWKDDLTITEAYIKSNFVYVLYLNQQLIGYYSFFELTSDIVKLDNMFIDPPFIGFGFGSKLMHDFLERAGKLNFKKVRLDSDPNAQIFYEKLGFKVAGQLKSTIKNRYLPIMELYLDQNSKNSIE